MSSQKVTKPPIGIIPRSIHDDNRRISLCAAIRRYMVANLEVNPEWIAEYNELVCRYHKRKLQSTP